ncbi:helix-turn-helix domain-containing protein [Streptomyces sp. NPDC101112]|uniref:nSTAND1 domain-containing NTPase n=1 Tax=Streptomyces sp. NPDC101112 TaxID=3366105 RepID=UPI00380CBE09
MTERVILLESLRFLCRLPCVVRERPEEVWALAGRPEVPLDPAAGPAQRFAWELRKLREDAGGITYRSLAQRAGYGVTTLSQAAAGEQLPTLPVVLAYVRACGGEPAWWEARWQQAVEESVDAGTWEGDAGAQPPYRGLARFEAGDSRRFFGREQLTSDLLDLVRRRRFAAVFGPSGSGKSSLLRASLIPTLQHSQEPGLRPAAIRILTPGEHPVRAHAALLTPNTSGGGADTFVIVDQFEEIFTLCHDADERTRFINHLLTARQPESQLRVLLAVRGDFYGHCAEHRLLADALRDANLLAGAMSPAELRDAVVKPATAAGLTVERALTARLVKEVADAPGGLPLLSHVLLETWRRRRGKTLTLAGYEAAGALDGAIAKSAEQVYGRFTEGEAVTARRVLLRLIAPGDGTPDTRRPAQRAELESTGQQDTARVLEALARARLLTLDGDMVELAHEALITGWPRLRDWIQDNRERLRVHRTLTEASHAWQELGREADALYRGSRLATAQGHFGAAQRGDLTDLEEAFLTASVTAHQQALRAAARVTRRLRALTATLSILLVLSVTTSLVAWHQSRSSYRQRQVADTARQVALSRQLATQSAALLATNPELAALMAVYAYRMSPTSEALESLYTAAALPLRKTLRHLSPTPVDTVAFSPDGHILATSGVDGRVSLWDTGTGRLRNQWRAEDEPGITMVWSRDGRTLATTGGIDGVVRLWDTDSGRQRTSVRLRSREAGTETGAFSVAFSPDGRTLASGSHDGGVSLWDAGTGRLRRSLPRQIGPGVWVVFSPDGRTLASTSHDGEVSLWDAGTGRLRKSLPGPSGDPFNAVVFSPDSRTLALATSGREQTLQLRDADTGRLRKTLPGSFDSVAFNPDSRTLATSGDHTVRLWDTGTGRLRTLLYGDTSLVNAMAFSPDGHTLTTSSSDGTVRIWDITVNPRAIHTRSLNDAESMAISQDSRTLATGGRYGAVGLWDTRSGRRTSLLEARTAGASLALSPDGRTLAIDNETRGIELWNTSTGRLRKKVSTYDPEPASMAFNQQGKTLATTSPSRGTELWDTSSGRLRTRLGKKGNGGRLAFSPDGRTLAMEGPEGRVRLLDIVTGRLRQNLAGQTAPLVSLAFSPDGRSLAAAGGNGAVVVWHRNGTSSRHRFLRSLAGSVGAVAFSPDGRTLATVSIDHEVLLRDTATGGILAELSGHSGPVTSMAWSRDGHTLTTAGADQTVRVWNAALPLPATAISRICHATGRDLTADEQARYLPGQEAERTSAIGCPPATRD